jgi:hypothetical protein
MVVQDPHSAGAGGIRFRHLAGCVSSPLLVVSLLALTLIAVHAPAQEQQPNWQAPVRKYCDASDWPSALRVLDKKSRARRVIWT